MLVEETYPPQDWAARASAVQVALKSSASMERGVQDDLPSVLGQQIRAVLHGVGQVRGPGRFGGGSACIRGICLGRAVHRGIRSTGRGRAAGRASASRQRGGERQ